MNEGARMARRKEKRSSYGQLIQIKKRRRIFLESNPNATPRQATEANDSQQLRVRPHANGDQSFSYLHPEEHSTQSLANIAHVPTL